MQTSVKPVQLRGHNFESEVTVRHRTTLGRYEASVAEYPNLVGEGVTEALALDDLATMLSSDPTAYAAVEARIKQTQVQAQVADAKAKADAEAKIAKPNGLKEIPPAGGAAIPTGTGAGVPPGSPAGDVKDTLTPTQGATITKA